MKTSFHNFYSDGLRLSATVHRPGDEDGSARPGIVLCQGINGIKEKYRFPEFFARRFVEAGFIATCFDYRGFGDAEGVPGRMIPLDRVTDTRNAITFLQQEPGVDASRIGLFGISFGGATSVFTAGIDVRVGAVVSVNGVGDGSRWLKSLRRPYEWLDFVNGLDAHRAKRVLTGNVERVDAAEQIMTSSPSLVDGRRKMLEAAPVENRWELVDMTLESAEAILDFRAENVLPAFTPRAALFIHGADDVVVPVDESLSMYDKAGEPRKLLLLDGTGHHDVYLGQNGERVVAASVGWFTEHLLSPAPRVFNGRRHGDIRASGGLPIRSGF